MTFAFENWTWSICTTSNESWFLRIGVERNYRNVSGEPIFESVDGKINFTMSSHPWFSKRGPWGANATFEGEAVCITNSRKRPYECTTKTKVMYSVCMVDLNLNSWTFWTLAYFNSRIIWRLFSAPFLYQKFWNNFMKVFLAGSIENEIFHEGNFFFKKNMAMLIFSVSFQFLYMCCRS